MAADELSIKLTAKDELSGRLRDAQKSVTDLRKSLKQASDEGNKSGDFTKYEKLRKELADATKSVEKMRKEQKQLNSTIQELERGPLTSVQKVGKAWTKLTKAFENPIVAAVSIGSMVAFGKASVNAFAEAEKQSMQLSLAMSKFPKLADTTRAEFDALNQSLMNLTGTDDDMLAATEAALARFDLTGAEITKLIPLVNDYAIATGQDAATAASTVGKALLGNAKALKSMGMNFKATGDRSKDLAAIMDILTQKVGGTGEAFGETAAGQLAIAQANMENFKETVGQALIPVLQTLVGIIRPVGSAFAAIPGPLRSVIVLVGGLGVAAMVATPKILAMKTAMEEANFTIGGFVSKRGGLMAGAAALTALATATRMLADANGNFYEQDNGPISYAEALKTVADPGVVDSVGHAISAITDFFVPHNTYLEDARKKLSDYDAQLASLVSNGQAGAAKQKFDELVASAKAQGIAVDELTKLMPTYAAAARDAARDTSHLSQEQRDAIIATENLSGALDALDSALQRREAKRNYKKALEDLVKKPSKDAADGALRDMESYLKTFKDPKKQAKVAGDVIKQFWDTVNKTKPNPATVKEYTNLLKTLTGISNAVGAASNPPSPTVPTGARRANGGPISGPGTGTSDTAGIFALSNGEYVTRAAATSRLGMATMSVLNRADGLPAYRIEAIKAAAAGVPSAVPMVKVPSYASSVSTDRSIHIGEIHAASGIDVQAEVLWALHRREMIERERS